MKLQPDLKRPPIQTGFTCGDEDLGGSSRGDEECRSAGAGLPATPVAGLEEPAQHWLLNASVAVQTRAKAEEVWDALSRVTTDHKTGDIVLTSKELQLACAWVLRSNISSVAELELCEKCLTLLWADEAGRQLQYPAENKGNSLGVSAAADMIQNVVVDWTFAKFMDFRKILNSRWNVFRTTAQDNSAVCVILKQNGKVLMEAPNLQRSHTQAKNFCDCTA